MNHGIENQLREAAETTEQTFEGIDVPPFRYRRNRRIWLTAITAFAVLSSIAFAAMFGAGEPSNVSQSTVEATGRTEAPTSTAEASTTTIPPGREGSPEPFVPDTTTIDGRNVAALVFPDGRFAEASWPVGLDLVSYGVRPHTWVAVADGYSTDLWFRHGAPADFMAQFENPQLIDTYPGADGGQVEYWRVTGSGGLNFLSLRVGTWTLLIPNPRSVSHSVRLNERDRRQWAEAISGHEDPTGLPVIEAAEPLRLADAGDSPSNLRLLMFSPHGVVELIPESCSQEGDADVSTRSWCTPAGNLLIKVDGDDAFRMRVRDGLQVDLEPAS